MRPAPEEAGSSDTVRFFRKKSGTVPNSQSVKPDLPSPQSLIDHESIQNAALSAARESRSLGEIRTQIAQFHKDLAAWPFFSLLAEKNGDLARAQSEVSSLKSEEWQLSQQIQGIDRYVTSPQTGEEGSPWNRFTSIKIGVLIAITLMALVNGGLAIAGFLEARPEFADSRLRAFGVGISILLLPASAIASCYYLVSESKPRLGKFYFGGICVLAVGCTLAFIACFGFQNAQDQSSMPVSLSDIGLEGEGTRAAGNGSNTLAAVTIIFQIMTDLFAAGASKIAIFHLYKSHGWVFQTRTPAHAELEKEVQAVQAKKRDASAEVERVTTSLSQLESEKDKFCTIVAQLASMAFNAKYESLKSTQKNFVD